jgi:hypothetical protein
LLQNKERILLSDDFICFVFGKHNTYLDYKSGKHTI